MNNNIVDRFMPVCNTQFGQFLFHPTVSPASLTVGIGLHRRSVTIGAIEMLVYMLMMMIYIRGTDWLVPKGNSSP